MLLGLLGVEAGQLPDGSGHDFRLAALAFPDRDAGLGFAGLRPLLGDGFFEQPHFLLLRPVGLDGEGVFLEMCIRDRA